MSGGIILFDGICNLCNSTVNFIIDHDSKKKFKFAALQSEKGQELLSKFNLPKKDFDTIILLKDEMVFSKSTAALKVAKELDGIFSYFYIFIIVPVAIRDIFYNLIARNRYKLFGKRESCRMPTQDLIERFL
ncbi:MAG: DUF393 domain-containing protein [Leptospiraceae bacterium]|nr:DUF393 domain-containing protein [Leptospiraceae bacterium]